MERPAIMLDLHKNWMEIFFLAVMIVGLLFALIVPSAVLSYAIAFISGIFAGRLIYERKNKIKFPYIVIIVGFVIGYVIGAYYGSRWVVVILFAAGAILSYKIYDKKILKDTKY